MIIEFHSHGLDGTLFKVNDCDFCHHSYRADGLLYCGSPNHKCQFKLSEYFKDRKVTIDRKPKND